MEAFGDIYKNNDFKSFLESIKEKNLKEKITWEQACTLSITDLLSRFAQWMRYEKCYSKETIQGKVKKVRKFFNDVKRELKNINKEIRAAYKSFLIKRMQEGIYSRNYVATILTDLNVFFCKFLGREDLRIPSIEKMARHEERITKDEVRKMLRAIENSKIDPKRKALHKIILIALWHELPRVGELTSMTIGDIKEIEKKVKLHSGKREKVPQGYRHPLATEEFLKAWNEYKKYRDSNDWSDNAPAFVQVGKKGKAISKDFVRRMLKKYARQAGIKKNIHPHLIRKSGGTELAMKNPKLAQIQLGHKSIKTTLDHYTIPNIRDKKMIESILSLNGGSAIDEVINKINELTMVMEQVKQNYLTYDLTQTPNEGMLHAIQ